MKRQKLTKEEQWYEDHAEEFVPVSREEFLRVKQAIEARKKDAVLNIRVNSSVLEALKHKAQKIGVKYQALISEILTRVAQA
jgi:predicted DNA binding CopG/RHH family protein